MGHPKPPRSIMESSSTENSFRVEDFPAFIIIDDKGSDFIQELNLG